MSRLDRILDTTRSSVERRRSEVPQEALDEQIGDRRRERRFIEALSRPGMSLIAEHKRRSPSAGAIREDLSLADVISAYEAGGAAALSVLTEEDWFGGSLDDLREARSLSSLPIIRKDFVVDRYQLAEAALGGADAVLLIVAALDPSHLAELQAEAHALGLDVLVEVHDSEELDVAVGADAELIGINNRNLKDFSVSLDTTFELLPGLPAGATVVSESGISSPDQLERLDAVGVDAVLVGESLMRSADLTGAVETLLSATT